MPASPPASTTPYAPQTLVELCAALDRLIADSTVQVIVLAARGLHFVAGADLAWLDELRAMTPAQVRAQVYTSFKGAAERLYRCPKPTIAVVQGRRGDRRL